MTSLLFLFGGGFAALVLASIPSIVIVLTALAAGGWCLTSRPRLSFGIIVTVALALGLTWAAFALHMGDMVRSSWRVADWTVWVVGTVLALAPIGLALHGARNQRDGHSVRLFFALGNAGVLVSIGYGFLIFWPGFRALWGWMGLSPQ